MSGRVLPAMPYEEYAKVKDDPKQIAIAQYGSQYFNKQCKAKLEAKLAGGR